MPLFTPVHPAEPLSTPLFASVCTHVCLCVHPVYACHGPCLQYLSVPLLLPSASFCASFANCLSTLCLLHFRLLELDALHIKLYPCTFQLDFRTLHFPHHTFLVFFCFPPVGARPPSREYAEKALGFGEFDHFDIGWLAEIETGRSRNGRLAAVEQKKWTWVGWPMWCFVSLCALCLCMCLLSVWVLVSSACQDRPSLDHCSLDRPSQDRPKCLSLSRPKQRYILTWALWVIL